MVRPEETFALTEAELERVNAELEGQEPQAILRWAIETFWPQVTLACSFGGISGMALLDMAVQIRPDLEVFYLDTDLLFPETYQLVARCAERYGITPVAYKAELTLPAQAAQYGDALWARDPDRCCALRKVAPNRRALAGKRAWISGLRRDQAATRQAVRPVEPDRKFGLLKVNPLAAWTERQVWAYLVAHDVPYNALHDRGYPSLGCWPCTRPVAPGADPRSGRWQGFEKTECGLHTP